MSNNASTQYFNEEHAARYDGRLAKLEPIRAALHFLTVVALRALPADARVLCVGAGTGAELLALASHFPQWRFMAVDPSGPMLAICRKRADAAGVLQRCEFHEGFVSDLSPTQQYNAATSILVSQFITSATDRIAFFRDIAMRLVPGGLLVTADLSTGATPRQHEQRVENWHSMLQYAGLEPPEIAQMLNAWRRDVAILSSSEIETLLVQGGFASPVQISQALLIHAWLATRAG